MFAQMFGGLIGFSSFLFLKKRGSLKYLKPAFTSAVYAIGKSQGVPAYQVSPVYPAGHCTDVMALTSRIMMTSKHEIPQIFSGRHFLCAASILLQLLLLSWVASLHYCCSCVPILIVVILQLIRHS